MELNKRKIPKWSLQTYECNLIKGDCSKCSLAIYDIKAPICNVAKVVEKLKAMQIPVSTVIIEYVNKHGYK